MTIEQPTFPLTADEFAAALRRGHGRVVQHVDRHGSNGLEDELAHACVSCLIYDPQCEKERAPWLASLVDRAQMDDKVLHAIEAATRAPSSGNDRDMAQRSSILKELAAAGRDDARHLLYSSLTRLPHSSEVIGAEQIVALDGIDGLVHVARQLGRWLQADPDFWVDDELVAQFGEFGALDDAMAALEREATLDPDVASYLAGMCKTRESRGGSSPRFDVAAWSGAEILAHVNSNPKDPCHRFRRWSAQAADSDREMVFDALLASQEPEHVKRLFRCFVKTGVPRFDPRLLRWLDHSDAQVQWAAANTLASNSHDELRQAALRLMADGDMALGVALLENNFKAGDFALCAGFLERLEDLDEAHFLAGRLLALCEAHPVAEATGCLLDVYAHSPCSTCRRQAVEQLVDMDAVPGWVQAEAAFDADPDTRALVAADRRLS